MSTKSSITRRRRRSIHNNPANMITTSPVINSSSVFFPESDENMTSSYSPHFSSSSTVGPNATTISKEVPEWLDDLASIIPRYSGKLPDNQESREEILVSMLLLGLQADMSSPNRNHRRVRLLQKDYKQERLSDKEIICSIYQTKEEEQQWKRYKIRNNKEFLPQTIDTSIGSSDDDEDDETVNDLMDEDAEYIPESRSKHRKVADEKGHRNMHQSRRIDRRHSYSSSTDAKSNLMDDRYRGYVYRSSTLRKLNSKSRTSLEWLLSTRRATIFMACDYHNSKHQRCPALCPMRLSEKKISFYHMSVD